MLEQTIRRLRRRRLINAILRRSGTAMAIAIGLTLVLLLVGRVGGFSA